jgi:hypothetical protein
MKISDFDPLNNTLPITAGEALTRNDLVEIVATDGKAYRVRSTDAAAVATITYGTDQTSAATGRIVAQTTIVAGATLAYSRQAVVRDSSGNIFTLTADSTNVGLRLSKYSPSGTLMGSVVLTGSNVQSNHQLILLSNGNLASVAYRGTNYYYAVHDSALAEVKTLTASAETSADYYFSAIALSGGGFAIVYQQTTNPLLSQLATYDNTGTAVLAGTTIWTRTGTTGSQLHRAVQLSDGNIAVAVSSENTVSSIGLYHGVVTTGGASVLAFTSLDTTLLSISPEISTFTGYYCVARANATNQLAFVFNNAGTLQGSGFTAATTNGTTENKSKLINDGAAFWLIWANDTGMVEQLTKLPVAGTDYITTNITTSGTTNYGYLMDAFYENGAIVGVAMDGSGNVKPLLFVASTASGLLVGAAATLFGSAPGTTNGYYPRIISGGDGAFICLYDYATTASTNLCIGKYSNTAIVGVAAATTSSGSLVPVKQNAGAYSCNAVAGSPAMAFDMSATTALYGNKGTVMNNCVVLKGI